jgi:phosphoenolpyruvate synthase/pyruvate phosphate dikinase
MFFAPDRIDLMRAMILSENIEDRKQFLNEMLPFQREDFLTMFKECRGRQVKILYDMGLFQTYGFIDLAQTHIYMYIDSIGFPYHP